MTPTAIDSSEQLVRRLSVVGVWLLVINGMIGAGIFGVPAEVARLAGTFSPWVFAICGLLIMPVMLCFAQLGSYFCETGGPILYAGTAFGSFVGFQIGWCLYVGRLLAFAANANVLISSLGYFSTALVAPLARIVLLFLLCAWLTAVNVLGSRGAMRWLSALTILKFVPLGALIIVGLLKLHPDFGWQGAAAPHDLGAAVLLAIYVFGGFESGSVAAGEARNPRRDVARALLAALFVCCLLYALIQAVSITALPALAATARPLVEVAATLMGPWGALLLTAGVVVSVGGNLVSSMFTTPRVTYRLALDKHLPEWFGTVHPTFRTPIWSIIFYGAACFLLAATGSFIWLAGLSVLTRIPVYLCCVVAIPTLRKRFGNAPGAWTLPGGNVIPLLAAAVCIWLLMQVRAASYASAAAFLAAGWILFLAAHRPSKQPEGFAQQDWAKKDAQPLPDERSNPKN